MTLVSQHIILQSPASNDPLLDLNTQPSLDLQFATGKTLDDRVSGLPLVNHQRDASSGKSAGTYVGSDGLIKTSVVNLLTYSEQFEQSSSWLALTNTTTVTPNATTAPDGTNSADLITAAATAPLTSSLIYQTALNQSNKDLVGSIYVKSSGSANIARFFINGDGGSDRQILDVTLTNEWKRVVLPVFNTTAANAYVHVKPGDDDNQVKSFYIWGAQLEEGSTATTYVPTTTVASAAPRFDHDPVTGESLGLLIEESRTNLETYSEVFTDSSWAKTDSSVVANSIESPDGLSNATKVVENTNNAAHGVYKNHSGLTSGVTYTHSVFAKAGERSTLQLSFTPGSDYANFNLLTGGITYATTGSNASIVEFPGGWYKCSASFTPSSVALVRPFILVYSTENPSRISSYTGDGTSGVYIWGAQLEAGSFQTSYIPTTSSAATRAADIATIGGTNFSSWYNQSEGTIFMDADGVSRGGWSFDVDGVGSNRHWNYHSTSQLIGSSGGSTNYSFVFGVTSTAKKTTLGYALNNNAGTVNGAAVQSDTSCDPPVGINRVKLGGIGNIMLNGTISRFTYYPYRLADATLQEITS